MLCGVEFWYNYGVRKKRNGGVQSTAASNDTKGIASVSASDHCTDSPIQLQFEFPPDEEWRDVQGWADFYEVSNLGKVRVKQSRLRSRYKAGDLMKQFNAGGYLHVVFCRGQEKDYQLVHRLVMAAFVGPANGLDVNHKNGIKDDNRLDNLEYMTRRENIIHSLEVLKVFRGAKGEDHWEAKLNAEKVRDIRRRQAAGETDHSIAKIYNVSSAAVRQIRTGRSWKHIA